MNLHKNNQQRYVTPTQHPTHDPKCIFLLHFFHLVCSVGSFSTLSQRSCQHFTMVFHEKKSFGPPGIFFFFLLHAATETNWQQGCGDTTYEGLIIHPRCQSAHRGKRKTLHHRRKHTCCSFLACTQLQNYPKLVWYSSCCDQTLHRKIANGKRQTFYIYN